MNEAHVVSVNARASIPHDPLRTFHEVTFAGVPCAQWWSDFALWERLLNLNPQLVGIVEIGTYLGGFSRYLHAQALARGMFFVTYDSIVPPSPPPGFERRDVFIEKEQIRLLIDQTNGPIALFCDGGNKPREAMMFGPMLKPGSVLVAHDWGTANPEFTARDERALLDTGLFVCDDEIDEWRDNAGSASAVYRRVNG